MAGSLRRGTHEARTRSLRARGREMVGREIEMIMGERERLLRAAGAAAALVRCVELGKLPAQARAPVQRLGALLDALPEETLCDALESLYSEAPRLPS